MTLDSTAVHDLMVAIHLLRMATMGHSHFDPTGGHGAGCPSCILAAKYRNRADEILKNLGLFPNINLTDSEYPS